MKFLNACLLIIGTAVGAGMLGMPVESSTGGYIPSLFFLFLSWLTSLISALFFVEALSVIKESVNFSTLSQRILGNFSKVFILLIYLILFLSLIFAYTKGGGIFLSDLFSELPVSVGTLIFLLLFFPFLLQGARAVGKINIFLTIPMFVALFLILFLGIKQVNFGHFIHKNWKNGLFSLPILLTAFSFHGIIPSIFNYLDHNKKKARKVIFIGSFSTCIIYLLWQTFVMGVVPFKGDISLHSAWMQDQTAITPLRELINSSMLSYLAELFYFCALTTSFLGVSLGLIDFLIDAFKIKRSFYNKLLIMFLLFFPAFILSGSNLRIFYLSLKYGAGLACMLLLVLFPTFLVISLIQKHQLKSSNKMSIKAGIALTLTYSLTILYVQLSSC